MSRFTKYAWFNVGYCVLVILWGAVVRATGSGAGCGRHWPACNGEVIPRAASVQTMIEFSHRLTSGLTGIFIIILLVWAYRAFERGSLVRRGAMLSFVFVLIEGGIGAGLVRLELVEDNASVLRAAAIAVHLVNTYVLLMWLVLTAWASSAASTDFRGSKLGSATVVGLVLLALLSAAGAVTALGDTLLLSGSLAAQFGEENVARHFLVQLRVIHPVMAVLVSVYLVVLSLYTRARTRINVLERLATGVIGIVVLQIMVGLATIILQAPVAMQITHLLLADVMWIVVLLLTFEIFTRWQDAPARTLQPA